MKFLIFFIIIISLLINTTEAKIEIIAKVNNEIITNFDLQRESEYLKILNPNIKKLDNQKIFDLSKKSLINEIIKKKEIDKYIDFDQKNDFIETQLKNLYTKLNIKNEDEFENKLKSYNTYNLDEIRKKIKIELFWNDLIFSKYKDQVVVDRQKLIEKIEDFKNKTERRFLISEIIFNKKKNQTLEETINEINLSIEEIGFNNAANIFSMSQSAKIGGKVGWVNESSLSKLILEKLEKIKIGETTEIFKIGNDFLILKLEDLELNKIKLDEKIELEKLTQAEINIQLNRYSRIYFDKAKMNFSIYEE
jgi:peptidyl-prolyl cis-trans isomerase SurA